ncbi:MAG: tRNA-intron lyase [Candidatus Pacearchaeota archaeon]|nr:tRNA-intron lyase [Candidatus Pacearchaeota archaeon]
MEKIIAYFVGGVLFSNSSEAMQLMKKSSFGELVDSKVQYSLVEGLFLVKSKKMEVFVGSKKLSEDKIVGKFQRIDKKFSLKFVVFSDLRKKGYVVKTALKFGADFRVYDKGSRPGGKHARWVVFVEREASRFSWHDFSAKNRVANSTKKKLLLAIVDEESDVSYYEVGWIKP